MKFLTSTVLLAAMAITNAAALPIAADKGIMVHRRFPFNSNPNCDPNNPNAAGCIGLTAKRGEVVAVENAVQRRSAINSNPNCDPNDPNAAGCIGLTTKRGALAAGESTVYRRLAVNSNPNCDPNDPNAAGCIGPNIK